MEQLRQYFASPKYRRLHYLQCLGVEIKDSFHTILVVRDLKSHLQCLFFVLRWHLQSQTIVVVAESPAIWHLEQMCTLAAGKPRNVSLQQDAALADWTKHDYLLVGWPRRNDTWRDHGAPAQASITRFVSTVLKETTSLRVIIVEDDSDISLTSSEEQFVQLSRTHSAGDMARLDVLRVPMDDSWVRDTGPVMLSGGNGALFRFNAWGGTSGGCYRSVARDALLGTRICESFRLGQIRANMILEGGSVSADGEGTILTTKECLLNANRNPGLTQADIEEVLCATLGAKQVVWLPEGAAFDTDANGHVDNMAVFVGPGHVLLLWAEEEQCKEQNRRSMAALEVLKGTVDALGKRFIVSTVTMPEAVIRTREEAGGVVQAEDARVRPEGERVCASYVNLVVAEDTVLAPKFGDKRSDERALRELEATFERYNKKVVMVDAREFVLAGGGLHCLTLSIST